jgi:hypothetical protein
MHKESDFRELLKKRGMDSHKIEVYVKAVGKAVKYFEENGIDFSEDSVLHYKKYVSHLIHRNENSYENLMAIGRYSYLLDLKKVWIYFASILGGHTVFPSIKKRLEEITGEKMSDKIFNKINMPSLGSSPDTYPDATKQLMNKLKKQLKPEEYRIVLAGNHHRIPAQSFLMHKEWLKEMNGDINNWLKRIHDFAVADLEHHLKEDKVWYEQIITKEIVEYVKNNQEILSGIRKGDWIYNTKFPYAPEKYLDEKDPLLKRYHMCHCPLAREAILTDISKIPMDWCYCSAGYSKFRYDIAFDEETEVELLESVFSGSDKCRFRTKIPEKWRCVSGNSPAIK